jgi:hypothetical protein
MPLDPKPQLLDSKGVLVPAVLTSVQMKTVPIGARGEAEEIVKFEHTLTSHHPQLPPVYSTPDMIRLMETAAFRALHPYCEDDEITVGTAINIEHRAASGVGVHIWQPSSLLMGVSIPCVSQPRTTLVKSAREQLGGPLSASASLWRSSKSKLACGDGHPVSRYLRLHRWADKCRAGCTIEPCISSHNPCLPTSTSMICFGPVTA